MFPISVRAPKPGFAAVTLLLIAVNIYFFVNEIAAPDSEAFINQYALISQAVNFSNLATLTPFISAQFLHAGILHLVSNMWFLFLFGPTMEKTLGKIPFLIFYLATGAFGFFIQLLFLSNLQIPILGASGAIAGVLGGFLVFYPKAKVNMLLPIFPLFFVPIPFPAQLVLIYWFATQLFNGVAGVVVETAAVGGVAWWAHVGGFGIGFLLAKLWTFK